MNGYSPDSVGLLEPLQNWLSDPLVSEIIMNKPGEIYVDKEGKQIRHEVPELDNYSVDLLFKLLANENEKTLGKNNPILNGSLRDGSRFQIVLPPVALHHALSIRRKVVKHFTLDDFNERGFYRKTKPYDMSADSFSQLDEDDKNLVELYHAGEWDQFIKLAIECKKNIVLSGGTHTGKTTYLESCINHIPLDQRIILLEDTRELEIPHPNKVNLLSSKEEGIIGVDMQSLIQCCLRLRPDRIIMGEIRGKEMKDFVDACSTGHDGTFTSIHASSPSLALMRMVQLYKQNNVPSMTDGDIRNQINEVVDIIVQIGKETDERLAKSIYFKHGQINHGSQ